MYNNTNKDIAIVYNPEIILKIREMMKEGFDKLKSFVKLDSNEKYAETPNFKFYHELDESFDEISSKLKELKLNNEYNYFLSISDYILYIIYQNSIDCKFGHCNFALELLEFFMELFKTNVNFYNSSLKISDEDFKIMQNKFKEQYWEYRSKFYCDIYEYSDDFNEKEMYEFAKSLKE